MHLFLNGTASAEAGPSVGWQLTSIQIASLRQSFGIK
jgi:hypothetical protein